MKKIRLSIFTCIIAVSLNAQRFHLNILGGWSNYGGDLQSKSLTLKDAKAAIAVGMSYELSQKFSLRSEYSYTNLAANDAKSTTLFQQKRNLNFKTYIQELNFVAEYDLLNIYEHQLVPYIFAGVGIFKFNPYTYDSLGVKNYLRPLHTEGQGLVQYAERQPYTSTQFNIPVGAGVKLALSDNIRVGAELGFRALFTDYLDDVSTTYVDLNLLSKRAARLSYRGDELKPPLTFPGEGAQRGNPSVKDNYYMFMLRFSYRLHFSSDKATRNIRSKYNCPPVKD